MKKVRLFGRSISILIGAVGVGALISSCRKKERTCSCETNVTYTYAYSGAEPVTITYKSTYVIKDSLKKCSHLNKEISLWADDGSGSTYTGEGTMICKKN